MDDLSKKTRQELEEEIVRLKNIISSDKYFFPGLSVIHNVEKMDFARDEKFRVLFNYSQEAVFLVSKSRITEVNDAAVYLFGYEKEELLHKTIKQLSSKYQPDGRTKQDWKNIEKKLLEQKNVEKLAWFFTKNDASLFQSEITVSPVNYGNEDHLLLLIKDVSDKKAFEQAKKRIDSEQHFVQSGSWLIDFNDFSASWSESMFKMHQLNNLEKPPSLKEYIENYIDEEQKNLFSSLIRKAIKKGEEFTIDLKINLPGGEKKYFFLNCKTESEDERKRSKLFGICLDITERKLLENALLESKESYKQLVNSLPDGVIIYTQEKILYANKGAFTILGLKEMHQEDIQNISIFDFLIEKYYSEIE